MESKSVNSSFSFKWHSESQHFKNKNKFAFKMSEPIFICVESKGNQTHRNLNLIFSLQPKASLISDLIWSDLNEKFARYNRISYREKGKLWHIPQDIVENIFFES